MINLPDLRYSADALSPVIGEETISFHYGKHFASYVNNLNELIKDTEFADMTLDTIAAKAQGSMANNAGQALNHALYFEQFTSTPTRMQASGALLSAIEREFESFARFKEEMSRAASTLFGSGWAWLCADSDGRLSIRQMQNADNPLRHGLRPILTFDVWEHAYYLDYKNRRPDYISALWNILDWDLIEERY